MPEGLYTPNRLLKVLRQRLSLRKPQVDALEILSDLVEVHLDLSKDSDAVAQLEIIKEAYSEIEDFERDFPSLCFALATGVGKTRLMGAFVAYLVLVGKSRHFMVIAPSTTIYQKLIADFTPNTPKYVFKGLTEFATNPPVIVTGEDWEKGEGVKESETSDKSIINIFNVQKIDRDDGKIRKLQETIGESYYKYLAGLPDLVLLMDEAHRYRAKAGMTAIAELKPVLGLEVTATPKTTGSGATDFKNVIYNYPLSFALRDELVKIPTAITIKDFKPENYDAEQLQKRKLIDAVRWHEEVKVKIKEYARANKTERVHPFILVVAQDTSHATEICTYIQSDEFYDGKYRDKVIEIHSNQRGEESEDSMRRLVELETTTETEIVIHVNKLKEGWDVSNLFTIVPLRTSASDILTEQTLGRGLRLPYGKRTGDEIIDSLGVIAHDHFTKLIETSKQPDSITVVPVELESDDGELTQSITIPPNISGALVGTWPTFEGGEVLEFNEETKQLPSFESLSDKKVVCETLKAVREIAEPRCKNGLDDLNKAGMRSAILEQVNNSTQVQNLISDGTLSQSVENIVGQCLDEIIAHTIEIPEIIITPRGEISFNIDDFDLSRLEEINQQPVESQLLARALDSLRQQTIAIGTNVISVNDIDPIKHLIDMLTKKNDIDYDDYANLLNKLARQMVEHLKGYLESETEIKNVVLHSGPVLANFIHQQINEHRSSCGVKYQSEIKKGFKLLRPQVFSGRSDMVLPYTQAASPLRDTPKYIFRGFHKCSYPAQKFQSEPERKFAELLEDEARANIIRWVKPAKNQFNIKYDGGALYNPDFIIETAKKMIIAEVKRHDEVDDEIVCKKKDATLHWISFVNEIADKKSKKQWCYLFVPDDRINPAVTLDGLMSAHTSN